MGQNEEKYKELRNRLLSYIKNFAQKNGITQEKIAERTGFSSNNVSRMLQGRYTPTLDNFIRLAESIDHNVELLKSFTPESIENSGILPKFMFTVDPLNNELYILHRQFPACLIHIVQETPVRLIIEDIYDEMGNPADILTMPFIEEAKSFWRSYGQTLTDKN